MSSPDPSSRSEATADAESRRPWLERRRQKIADEIARNRRGEYKVPTWVLAVALVLMVGAWAALIILS